MPNRTQPGPGGVVKGDEDGAVDARATSSGRKRLSLEERAAEALRAYRTQLNQVELAEAALNDVLEAKRMWARRLHTPATSPEEAADALLAEYRDVLDRLAKERAVYSAAQARLDAARDRYATLDAELGCVPRV